MGKNEIKKVKKKQQILQSAYSLFTTIGFAKTTVLSIALKAGVGKGTFYLYFDSKEDVRDELIRMKSSKLLTFAIDHLSDHCATSCETLGVPDKIIYITDYIINYLSKDIALLQFISKYLSWGLFMNKKIEKENEDVLNFQTYIFSMMEKDGTKLKNPSLLIFTIIELVNSTCYNVILEGEPVTLSEYKPYLYSTIRLLVKHEIVD